MGRIEITKYTTLDGKIEYVIYIVNPFSGEKPKLELLRTSRIDLVLDVVKEM